MESHLPNCLGAYFQHSLEFVGLACENDQVISIDQDVQLSPIENVFSWVLCKWSDEGLYGQVENNRA